MEHLWLAMNYVLMAALYYAFIAYPLILWLRVRRRGRE